jgi:hypothetical protein
MTLQLSYKGFKARKQGRSVRLGRVKEITANSHVTGPKLAFYHTACLVARKGGNSKTLSEGVQTSFSYNKPGLATS